MGIIRTLHILKRRTKRLTGAAFRLRPADLPTLAQIVRLVTRYQFLHDRRSIPGLVAAFDAPPHPDGSRKDLRRLTYLIDLVMKTVYRDRYCMKRSLIHFYYMRRAGMPVTLSFGVAKEEERMTGHAWVEVRGLPYAERADPRRRFVRTYTYPGPDSAQLREVSALLQGEEGEASAE